jgi:hypothetical protein
MLQSQHDQLSSSNVTVRLAADGQNWKDWIKQLTNYAAGISALRVLDGNLCPPYNPTDAKYALTPLFAPTYAPNSSEAQIETETNRIYKLNKGLIALNANNRQLRADDRAAYENWVAKDGKLQNTVLSSINTALVPQIRDCNLANAMQVILKGLNNTSDYANAATAWAAFIDVRADTCKSIREYNGKFREAISDLAIYGLSIAWLKPSVTTPTTATRADGLGQLLVIYYFYGLEKVLPDWVQAREDDLRMGQS